MQTQVIFSHFERAKDAILKTCFSSKRINLKPGEGKKKKDKNQII